MTPLDDKINQQFPGLVVRKDLVKAVKGNAIVPSYVLEYLLGQYCATSDEATIQTGIDTVKEILGKHYVHRNEAGLIRSHIREKGRYKVIDKISVALNDKTDAYEAEFSNLGIKKVLVDPGTVKTHPKLLVSGVWCIADVEYAFTEDKHACPWLLSTLKPIQLSRFDFEAYLEARQQFSTDEWIDLLIQSIGFDPALFGRRSKLTQLIRLIPFCERNYNLIELGPKGTGKSHIYSEFSPHGILISGGEVTVPKLFVNNQNGRIGLVGYWDCVAFDEFAGKQKRVDKALVDILKNYMANKSFSRGVETLGAEASMVFVGNTRHTVPYMLKHSDLFSELPDKFYDSAFLDRIHCYIPGWEVDIIRGEMFSSGYGFVVDYLAEILRSLRNRDDSDRYQAHCSLSADISTRDRDGIHKTFSGLMKLLFPHGEAKADETEELLRLAIEGRKRVKDQLLRLDSTYVPVRFAYLNAAQEEQLVRTLEEEAYPKLYHKRVGEAEDGQQAARTRDQLHRSQQPETAETAETRETPAQLSQRLWPENTRTEQGIPVQGVPAQATAAPVISALGTSAPGSSAPGSSAPERSLPDRSAPGDAPRATALEESHLIIQENQTGISYDRLLGPYLQGATKITLTDPYIRLFYQQRNLMEFLETVVKHKATDEEVAVHLITIEDELKGEQQRDNFAKMQASAAAVGLRFSWEFDTTRTIHARHILTDHGWKITLDRGLDIFQPYEMNDAFAFANRSQEHRACKAFEVTFMRQPHHSD